MKQPLSHIAMIALNWDRANEYAIRLSENGIESAVKRLDKTDNGFTHFLVVCANADASKAMCIDRP